MKVPCRLTTNMSPYNISKVWDGIRRNSKNKTIKQLKNRKNESSMNRKSTHKDMTCWDENYEKLDQVKCYEIHLFGARSRIRRTPFLKPNRLDKSLAGSNKNTLLYGETMRQNGMILCKILNEQVKYTNQLDKCESCFNVDDMKMKNWAVYTIILRNHVPAKSDYIKEMNLKVKLCQK